MLSFALLLATLFTVGQCGGGDVAAGHEWDVHGTGGPDPTPKPTEPPFFKGSGCGGFTEGICDETSTDLILTSMGLEHSTEPTCAQYCASEARERGSGCCQFGGCTDTRVGRKCGTLCGFYVGAKITDTPYSEYGTSAHGKKFKQTRCEINAEEANAAWLDFAMTSDESTLLLARNLCAAVGLASVLYGAYKFYFGAKN